MTFAAPPMPTSANLLPPPPRETAAGRDPRLRAWWNDVRREAVLDVAVEGYRLTLERQLDGPPPDLRVYGDDWVTPLHGWAERGLRWVTKGGNAGDLGLSVRRVADGIEGLPVELPPGLSIAAFIEDMRRVMALWVSEIVRVDPEGDRPALTVEAPMPGQRVLRVAPSVGGETFARRRGHGAESVSSSVSSSSSSASASSPGPSSASSASEPSESSGASESSGGSGGSGGSGESSPGRYTLTPCDGGGTIVTETDLSSAIGTAPGGGNRIVEIDLTGQCYRVAEGGAGSAVDIGGFTLHDTCEACQSLPCEGAIRVGNCCFSTTSTLSGTLTFTHSGPNSYSIVFPGVGTFNGVVGDTAQSITWTSATFSVDHEGADSGTITIGYNAATNAWRLFSDSFPDYGFPSGGGDDPSADCCGFSWITLEGGGPTGSPPPGRWEITGGATVDGNGCCFDGSGCVEGEADCDGGCSS